MLRKQKIKVSPKKIMVEACSSNHSSCDYHYSIFGEFCRACPHAPKEEKQNKIANLLKKLLVYR